MAVRLSVCVPFWDNLTVWLSEFATVCLSAFLTIWQSDCLSLQQSVRLPFWQYASLIVWVCNSLIVCLSDCLTVWLSDCHFWRPAGSSPHPQVVLQCPPLPQSWWSYQSLEYILLEAGRQHRTDILNCLCTVEKTHSKNYKQGVTIEKLLRLKLRPFIGWFIGN